MMRATVTREGTAWRVWPDSPRYLPGQIGPEVRSGRRHDAGGTASIRRAYVDPADAKGLTDGDTVEVISTRVVGQIVVCRVRRIESAADAAARLTSAVQALVGRTFLLDLGEVTVERLAEVDSGATVVVLRARWGGRTTVDPEWLLEQPAVKALKSGG
jgi:hypothetical protein